jgi:ectoine hydroxylase-related dioxygenase (phytanoyl-CoA dioxygenase family)
MKSQFQSDGYAIITEAIDNDTFGKLKFLSKLYTERTYERQNHTGNGGHNLFRTENIVHDFLVPELFNNEKLYTAAYEILGEGFILKELLHYFSMPDNTIQELHRDVNDLYRNESLIVPTFLIAFQIPLVNFDYESGGTRIIKGTHLSSGEPPRLENEDLNKVPAHTPVLKEQDCLVRDCRAWHGAGVNKTGNSRAMYTIAFAKSWYGGPAKVSKEFYFRLDRDKRHMVTI